MGNGVIAYITPEIAIDQSLHTYSGGLGVVGGDLNRSARKLGIPLVSVSILPKQGYYDQRVENGRMKIEYVSRNYDGILERTGIKFSIEICSSPVWIEVWHLPEDRFNTAPVYFLDTDIDPNDYVSRINTLQLYGGSLESGANLERKIAQSLVLGVGGVEALKRLKIPVFKYHLNESHAAFAALKLLCDSLSSGWDLKGAKEITKSKTVFTTHTPVREGNPEYPVDMVMWMGGFYKFFNKETLINIGNDKFNMTAACLRLSGKVNAVSKEHAEVARKLWHWVNGDAGRIIAVTNGVSSDFWQLPEFRDAETPQKIAEAKLLNKRKLIEYVKEKTGRCFGENIALFTWARRFAGYKRAKLLFYEFEWLKSRLYGNKLQIIFAGKPHPDDFERVSMWNEILQLSYELPNIIMLPGYELELSKILKAGSDFWLNTPRDPLEASGTSGMSAAFNGAINISTRAGWMREANPDNCILFGTTISLTDQDAFDAKDLRRAIEEVAFPIYASKSDLYKMAINAKEEAEKEWTSDRMIRQYLELLYKD